MAQIYPQETSHVTIQQPIQNTNPFKTMNNEWHVGLYNCFDDMSQCNINVSYENFINN